MKDHTGTGIITTISTNTTELTAESLEDMSLAIKKLGHHQYPVEQIVCQRDGNRNEHGKWNENKHEDKHKYRHKHKHKHEKEKENKNKNES